MKNNYSQYGWVLLEKIFSDEEIDALQRLTEEFYAGIKDRGFPQKILEAYDWRPGTQASVHTNEYIDYQKHGVRELLLKPRLGEIAANLMGSPDAYFFNTVLFSKPAHKGNNFTIWHIDIAYLDNCTSTISTSAWIPLQEIGPQDSPLLMIKGSHLWNLTEEDTATIQEKIPYDPVHKTYKLKLSFGEVDAEVVPVLMKKGQVSFHHLKTLHGRCPNLSDQAVKAITVHYQDGKNRWKPWSQEPNFYICKNMSEQLYRKLPDGTPDFFDPDYCPKAWPIN